MKTTFFSFKLHSSGRSTCWELGCKVEGSRFEPPFWIKYGRCSGTFLLLPEHLRSITEVPLSKIPNLQILTCDLNW